MSKRHLCSTKPSPVEVDIPELTEAWFAEASVYKAGVLVKRGRPPKLLKKQSVKLRLDHDVLAGFKIDGPGWQTRINQALRDWLAAHPASEN